MERLTQIGFTEKKTEERALWLSVFSVAEKNVFGNRECSRLPGDLTSDNQSGQGVFRRDHRVFGRGLFLFSRGVFRLRDSGFFLTLFVKQSTLDVSFSFVQMGQFLTGGDIKQP